MTCTTEKYVWHGMPNDRTAGYEVLRCTLPAGHFPSGRHVCDEGAVISSWDGEGWRSFRHVKNENCTHHADVIRCLTCGYERLPEPRENSMTERDCKAALNIKGEWFGCQEGRHLHPIHGNKDIGAIWSSHDESVALDGLASGLDGDSHPS